MRRRRDLHLVARVCPGRLRLGEMSVQPTTSTVQAPGQISWSSPDQFKDVIHRSSSMSVFSTENGAKPQSRPAGGECLPFRSRNIRSCLQSSASPLNLFPGGPSRLGEGRSSIPLSPSLSRRPARPWKEPGRKGAKRYFRSWNSFGL